MPLVTVTKVADDHRTFSTANGNFAAFRVWAGEQVGEVVTKAETLEKRRAQFRDIIGKPTELIVEDQGQWDDGSNKPAKIKFPQQQQGGGGGKRDYVPRWTDTEAGARESNDWINRRRALELAVQGCTATGISDADTILAFGQRFHEFLKSPEIEPAPKVTRSEGRGMVSGDGSDTPVSDPKREEGGADGEAAPSSHERAVSPEEEQQAAYIQVLRSGPGNTQSVLQARALFESDARKVKTLRDLTLDELVAVIQAFKERVSA
jgi:hypothetical protein